MFRTFEKNARALVYPAFFILTIIIEKLFKAKKKEEETKPKKQTQPFVYSEEDFKSTDKTYSNEWVGSQFPPIITIEKPNGTVINYREKIGSIIDNLINEYIKDIHDNVCDKKFHIIKTLRNTSFKIFAENISTKYKKVKNCPFDLFISKKNKHHNINDIIYLCKKFNYKLDITVELDPAYNPNVNNLLIRFKNY